MPQSTLTADLDTERSRVAREASGAGPQNRLHPVAAHLLHLQRCVGNQAVNRHLQRYASSAGSASAQTSHVHQPGVAPAASGWKTVMSWLQRDQDEDDDQTNSQTVTPTAQAADSSQQDSSPANDSSIGQASQASTPTDAPQSDAAPTDPDQYASQGGSSSSTSTPAATDTGDPSQLGSQYTSSSSSESGKSGAESTDALQDTPTAEPLTGNCAAGKTTINVVNKVRAVSGKTLNEVYQNNFTVGEAGSVQPVFDPSPPTYCPTDAGAVITSAIVNINEVKTMPKWTEYDSQCKAAKDEWDRWWAILNTHEDGHIAIDKNKFANVHLKLQGTTDPDTKLDAVTAAADKANKDYDTAQGNFVTLNAGIGCP